MQFSWTGYSSHGHLWGLQEEVRRKLSDVIYRQTGWMFCIAPYFQLLMVHKEFLESPSIITTFLLVGIMTQRRFIWFVSVGLFARERGRPSSGCVDLQVTKPLITLTWMPQQSPVGQSARSLLRRYLSPVCPRWWSRLCWPFPTPPRTSRSPSADSKGPGMYHLPDWKRIKRRHRHMVRED